MMKKLAAITVIACLIVVSLSSFMFSQTQSVDIGTLNIPSEVQQPDTLTQPSNSPETGVSDDNSCKDTQNEDEQSPRSGGDNCSSEIAQDLDLETDVPLPDGRIFLTSGPPYPYIPTAIPIKIKDPILPLDPIG